MHEQFGRYILLERIATGGMAEIFKAKAPGLGGFEKILAIKRLHPRYSQDADFIEMLIDEAHISVELSHVNIGQIFDLGKVDDHYFIAMEYIDGRDLYRVMKRIKERGVQFPVDAAAYVALEAAAGLDYAHRKKDARGRPMNIIHRDVSPQNVLLSYEGEVKLVDFGIAKAALRAYETESGIIKGKFYYMSPEQARGEPLDHRTDVFSLGIVLYEMLTGDLLYKDDDEVTLLSRVRKADIAPPTRLRPDIPDELERIVMRALARDREDRYPSALHLNRDLQRFLRHHGSDFGKARLGRWMRELFLDEGMSVDDTEDSLVLRDRSDFVVDRRSLILQAPPGFGGPAFDESDDATAVDPHLAEPSVVVGDDALDSVPDLGEPSDLMELGSSELMLLDDQETVNLDGPGPVPEAYDSIERTGPAGEPGAPAAFGDDPFEDETTRAFHGAARRRSPSGPPAGAEAPASPDAVPFADVPTPTPGPAPAAPPRARPARAVPMARPVHQRPTLPPGGEPVDEGFNRQPTVIVPMDAAAPPAPARPPRASRTRRPGDVDAATPVAALPVQGGRRPAWLTRERALMAAALTGVVVIAAVVTSLLTAEDPPPPAREPKVEPVPTTGTLAVKSYPSGARVKIDDVWQLETTPTKIQVPAPRTVRVRVQLEQYAPYEAEVTIEPGQERTIDARLEKIRGVLTVESIPSGASVFIDGEAVGLTPLTRDDVPADRPVRLRVTKDGFEPYEKTIDWDGERERSVEVRLEAVEAEPPPVARREVRRRRPPRSDRPRRRPRRRARRRARDREPPGIVRADRATADRRQGIGYLSVNARRWGSVHVNGQLVSPETPLVKYKLPAGRHRVHVCYGGDPNQCSRPKLVTVNRGENTVVIF